MMRSALVLQAVLCGLLPMPARAADGIGSVGYPSVEAARAALLERKDLLLSVHQGWNFFTDEIPTVSWIIPPADHEAYPAVAKRTFTWSGDEVTVEVTVQCGAPRPACEALLEDFQDGNVSIKKSLEDDRRRRRR